MNKIIGEARDYTRRLAADTVPPGVRVFVVPPHTALAAVRDCLPAGSSIMLGAQNAHWAPEGAGTGEISMRMIADAGAQLVELGHSERRQQFGETDATVALKVRAALDQGLTPLVCVGEPAAVRAAGSENSHVSYQVRAACNHLAPNEIRHTVFAYEPVWAIGSGGRPATPTEVEPVLAAIAETLAERSDGTGAQALLYGGGVNLDNAAQLLRVPNTDGLFVGRAAWTVDGLRRLIAVGAAHATTRAVPGPITPHTSQPASGAAAARAPHSASQA